MTADSGIVTLLVCLNLMLAGWIVIFLAAGFGTRWARVRAEARRARFAEHWETVLYGRIAGDTEALPKLARRDDAAFLLLWLHLAGYVRDEGEDGLRAAGTELGFDKRVIALLGAGAPWERLLAARAAALLRLDGAATHLQRLATGRDRTLALAAVEALLKIDPALGHASFLALVLRGGWSPCAMVAAANACPAAARRALEEALARARPGAATAVVRLLELIEDADAVPALRARVWPAIATKQKRRRCCTRSGVSAMAPTGAPPCPFCAMRARWCECRRHSSSACSAGPTTSTCCRHCWATRNGGCATGRPRRPCAWRAATVTCWPQ